MGEIDHTHDLHHESWVTSARGHAEFPVQNLPLGIFRCGERAPAVGVAIGDEIVDLAAVVEAGLLQGQALAAARAAEGPTLNGYMALCREDRVALRRAISEFLTAGTETGNRAARMRYTLLVSQSGCTMGMPATVGDYTDFFAGIHHARNAGRMLRTPEDPLWPNYFYVPIAYHGRSSSIVASGAEVTRPGGQSLASGETIPTVGPSSRLDYEFEFGMWVGGGNARGQSIPIGKAEDHVVGFCLLNDWSARDIQMWEGQPLGPFLAKSFATTVSPWVVTVEALAPFFEAVPPRPNGYPAPLPYLYDEADQRGGALNASLQAFLATDRTRSTDSPPYELSEANTLDLYWTFAQMIAHHTVAGCPLRPGDLIGSGTISGETRAGFGSLFELTDGGAHALTLKEECRTFLEDGDEVILRAHCSREGFASIGFGECRGKVVQSTPADSTGKSPPLALGYPVDADH